MYSLALSGGSFTVPGPLRTKSRPPASLRFPSTSEHRLWASLAAHDADRLALNDLHLRIDAGAGPIAEPVAHDLREVAHELVVALELIALDADDGTVVGNADQQVAAFGVEERGDRS